MTQLISVNVDPVELISKSYESFNQLLKKCSINTFFLYTSRQSSLDMAETSTSPCPPLAMKSYSLTESVKHRLSRIISVDDDSTPDDVNSEEPPKSE